ncbi:ATPase [Aureococcus anophagefferens]|nr:ATPase [Aureococcus anophagefferens]
MDRRRPRRSFKGRDRDFKSMGASSGPDWLSGSAAPATAVPAAAVAYPTASGQHGPPASTAGSFKAATSSPWAPRPAPTGSLRLGRPAPPPAAAYPAASTGNMDHVASTAGSFKGKDRDFKSGRLVRPRLVSGSAAPRPRSPEQ